MDSGLPGRYLACMRPYDRYWGKADPALAGYHLAAHHALDVAAVALRRVERSHVLRARLVRLVPGLEQERAAPTVACWVALHDIGKLDVRFQLKAPSVASSLDPARASCRFSGPYDHGRWGYHQLRCELRSQMDEHLGGNMEAFLQGVTGHHGELPSRAKIRADEDIDAFEAGDAEARRAFLLDVVRMFRDRGAVLPLGANEPTCPAVALVAGLCSVSDWIGSQAEFFPYEGQPMALPEYFELAVTRADAALDALRVDAPGAGKTFPELFPATPTPRGVQALVLDLEITREPQLVVVEAPMGVGKTEAALALASRMIEQGAASGLYFALPTMATSNGLFDRVADVVPRMWSGETNLMLAHSKSRRTEALRRLVFKACSPRRAKYGDGPFDDEAGAACAKWYLSSKRALLSQIGVGTIDQAMVAALQVRHHFVRLYGLATNVVVLDEIHAYDAYMSVVLERLVEWLGALGTSVILLSATLPAERRMLFEQAFARGARFLPVAPTAGSQSSAYPLVSVTSEAGRGVHSLQEEPPGYVLEVERVMTDDPESTLLPKLVELAQHGRVAWIRNTVSEAQQAWEDACALGAKPILFHARMRPRDRAAVEKQVLQGYGRDGNRDCGLVIATQVIEQSLDLDFDLMASDLAPIDLLLQRAGRLHRHLDTRARPAGFGRRLIVVTPTCEDVDALHFGPSGYVYDRVTLWLSNDSVAAKPVIRIPAEMRSLVESVYDSARRSARITSSAAMDQLQEAERKLRDRRRVSETKAAGCAIPPSAFDPVHLATRADDDSTVQALTREAESVGLLLVLWNDEENAALTLDGTPLVLDADSPNAWREADLLQDEVVSVPAYRVQAEATASGDVRAYDAWRAQAGTFLQAMRMGSAMVVPMRRDARGFKGRLVNRAGRIVTARYTSEKGLWFPALPV